MAGKMSTKYNKYMIISRHNHKIKKCNCGTNKTVVVIFFVVVGGGDGGFTRGTIHGGRTHGVTGRGLFTAREGGVSTAGICKSSGLS